jgi:hypothetical protein
MTLRILFISFLTVSFFACSDSDLESSMESNSESSEDFVEPDWNDPKVFMKFWLEGSFLRFSEKKYGLIWTAIIDTNVMFETRIKEIKKLVQPNNTQDLLTILTQVKLWHRIKSQDYLTAESNFNHDHLDLEISEHIQLFYDSKVRYHCIWNIPLKYRHVFLENGELRIYSWLGYANMEVLNWSHQGDTIFYHRSDTTLKYLETEGALCPTDSIGRCLWFI